MDLPSYLDWKKIKRIEAARALKVAPPTITRICECTQIPGPELAKKIVEWSGGAVTFADLLGVKRKPRPDKRRVEARA